ncbi:HAMP domain-containing sensor histidine kinase [Priestia taiwanensis]|uniref:Signal transduction histidine-protein kinase ArlS n=1 Tax=Priestia taiwanensis TaxID=1347902 RepID=A0A917AWK6_9BACI|nr:HAMP domain-containing histidine kinase [Priestia taiwanensis]MBM7364712.1 signal transduction histidine kinase [Priestia taiwanensis]GGE79050.1 sensor histidine kinase YkoH [Priestia taiwanensis]
MKIQNKIHLFSTGWLLLILLIINSAIYFSFYNITTSNEVDRLQKETRHLTDGINKSKEIKADDLLQPYLPANGMIRIIDEKSEVIIEQYVEEILPLEAAQFDRQESEGIYEKDGKKYAFVKLPVIWLDGKVVTLEVTEGLDSIQSNLTMLQRILMIASLCVLIPAFFAGRMLSNLLLRPVNSMIQTMEDIQERGIFKKIHLEDRSKDELYKMGNTFNKMMDLLQQNFEKQQQFVSDASHELKTPLTVIESYAKLLKRWGTKKQDVMEESVEAIYSEAIRMKDMTNQMLLLANNSAEWNLDMKEVDVTKLCCISTEQLEKAYGREFRMMCDETSVLTYADEMKLKQVLVVLLDNAMKYSKGTIEVDVGEQDEQIYFSVKDYGMGIPEEDLQKVFDRFFRVDKARSRETGGAGLGLSIAKQIVDAHQGSIQLESEEGKWTKVSVYLPVLSA